MPPKKLHNIKETSILETSSIINLSKSLKLSEDPVFNMSHNNYSIHSIIAAYGLGLAPHGYYLVKMMANAKGQSSNILYFVNNLTARSITYAEIGRVKTCPI